MRFTALLVLLAACTGSSDGSNPNAPIVQDPSEGTFLLAGRWEGVWEYTGPVRSPERANVHPGPTAGMCEVHLAQDGEMLTARIDVDSWGQFEGGGFTRGRSVELVAEQGDLLVLLSGRVAREGSAPLGLVLFADLTVFGPSGNVVEPMRLALDHAER